MIIDYATHYDEAYWTRSKTYQTPNGEKVYTGPSLEWDGFDLVAEAFTRVMPRNLKLLDIGCSSGDLIRRMMQFDHTLDAYGIDISKPAIKASKIPDRVRLWDITQGAPIEWQAKVDCVTAFDFLEHIYEEDLETTWKAILHMQPRYLVFLVATTLGEEFVHQKGQEVPIWWQETAVAGHVNVRKPSYWERFFKDHGWKPNWERMYRFAALRDMDQGWRNTGGWAMTNIWFLER